MKTERGGTCIKKAEAAGYRFRGRVWVEGPEGTFLGYGRVVLLERIRQYGSISEAARSLGMSYRHAWDLVDSMNRQAPAPLVTASTGGRGGGGAIVTETGINAVRAFWRFHKNFERLLQRELLKFKV